MDDTAAFNKAAEKIGRFLPAGAYTGFQYIAAQITTDGTCDQTQVRVLFITLIMSTYMKHCELSANEKSNKDAKIL